MSGKVKVLFEAEGEQKVASAFDKVGNSSRGMASKVNESTAANARLGERIGSNEQRFRGTADLLDGLGGAFGLPTEGATKMTRALGDMSGGFEVVSGIIPGLSSMFPKLAGAMTFISAHPLVIGILAGGAIIAGLILLEKKFGLVSAAVDAVGGAFRASWENGIKPALNFMLAGVELWLNTITTPVRLLSRIVPGIPTLPTVHLPRLDVGGTVLQTGVAVVHRGEVVTPAGSVTNMGGATINVYVAGSVTSERDLVDTVHEGLLRKQNRSSLGFRAA